MRALQIFVVILGVMILAAFAALFVAVASRMSYPRPATTAAPAAITIPAGARIENMGLGGDRLAIDLLLPDGSRHIVIIDLATGRQLRTIPLRTGP